VCVRACVCVCVCAHGHVCMHLSVFVLNKYDGFQTSTVKYCRVRKKI